MFKKEETLRVVYLAHAASGTGASATDAKPLIAGVMADVEDGDVITGVDFIVTDAISGISAIIIGDGVDPDGYVTDANITEGTPAVYTGSGALLSKRYSGVDTIDLAGSGASAGGTAVLVIKGYKV